MSTNPCEERRDAVAAAAVGDLAGEELAQLRSHVAGCTACAAHMASLEAAVGVLREDAAASPSAERRARVVAAARAVLAEPRIVPFAPDRGGFGGLLGAAAAAVLMFTLAGIGFSGGDATGPQPPIDLFNSSGAVVKSEGSTFVRTDTATGVVIRLTTHANATSRAMEGDTLQVGTLDIRFPADYRGPRGRQRIITPGGAVTVEAKPGARYLLEQWPGEAYLETGALTARGGQLFGDTGEVSLQQALDILNPHLTKPCRVTPEAAALRTRLTVTGASARTCLGLLMTDARKAGLAVGLVEGVRTFQGTPSQPALRAPQARREGTLFVEVQGLGRAVVEAAGSRERFEAKEGVQVMLTGRASRAWGAPTAEVRATLERRITVVGTTEAGAAAVALDGGAPQPIQAGHELFGHVVRHVGANGITLERNNHLVRIGIAGN